MKLIFLMKDYSVKHSSKIGKFYNDIQFILFPCDEELNTYLLVEPNMYMVKMKKAKVIIESVVQRCGYDYKDHYYPIGRIEKEIFNYTELIQYLFSIEKTKYFNKLMQMTDFNEIPPYMMIKYCFFSIRLYDENNKVIFKKKINIGEETKLSTIYVCEFYDPGNIVNNIHDIYFSELSLFKEHISIDPINNKWDLAHDKYKYNLCAVWLDETNSISFFHKDDIINLTHINSLYSSAMTFSIDKWDDVEHRGIVNCPEYDLSYFDYPLIIEYIIYLPYIDLVMKTCARIANNEYNEGELTEDDYKIVYSLEMEVNHKTKSYRFNSNNLFDLDKLMRLIEGS